MAGFFFNLGRNVRATLRKGKWVVQSLTGSEAEAIEAEFELGRDLAWGMLRQMEADPDPRAVQLLAELGGRLAGSVRDRRRRFCASPVNAAEVNAFALPGGFLFVTRPLLDLCGWDADEVAFILGHEMGHVLHGHAMQRILDGWMLHAAGRVMPVRGMAGAWLMQQAGELIHKSYSRDQELEADLLGVRLANAAGFDARAAVRLLGRLQAGGGPASELTAYFATHPPVVDRIAQINRYLLSCGVYRRLAEPRGSANRG
jgi:beta-barrel assembly-enhancing protease